MNNRFTPALAGQTRKSTVTQRANAARRAAAAKKKKPGTTVAVHKPQEPKSLLQVVSEASRDRSVDVVKMKELLAMAREQEIAAQERLYNADLWKAKEEMPPVFAASRNEHTKSNWARYEQLSAIVDPIIRRNGFVLTFGMSDSPITDHYRVICDVAHRGGFTRRYFLDAPSDAVGAKGGGTKTPVQGVISTVSYLQRNLKCLIFDIVVAGKDQDGNDSRRMAPVVISAEQVADLRARMAKVEIDDETFCSAFKIRKVEELPVARFAEALARIAQREAQRA